VTRINSSPALPAFPALQLKFESSHVGCDELKRASTFAVTAAFILISGGQGAFEAFAGALLRSCSFPCRNLRRERCHLLFSSPLLARVRRHEDRRKMALDMQPFGCIISSVMNAVFKALADPSRRKLLDELHKNNGQTLGQLCEHLDMTRQAVTKHLVILEKANLVATVWQGREKLHYVNPMPLHEIYERWIGKYERHRLQALSDLKKGLEQK